MDATNRMPGDAEAAGAAAGMRDTYGYAHCHRVGEELWFQPEVGAMPRPGRVVALLTDNRLGIQDTDGVLHTIGLELVSEF